MDGVSKIECGDTVLWKVEAAEMNGWRQQNLMVGGTRIEVGVLYKIFKFQVTGEVLWKIKCTIEILIKKRSFKSNLHLSQPVYLISGYLEVLFFFFISITDCSLCCIINIAGALIPSLVWQNSKPEVNKSFYAQLSSQTTLGQVFFLSIFLKIWQ